MKQNWPKSHVIQYHFHVLSEGDQVLGSFFFFIKGLRICNRQLHKTTLHCKTVSLVCVLSSQNRATFDLTKGENPPITAHY